MCAQPPALTVAGVPFPRLSVVAVTLIIKTCGSVCALAVLAFSGTAQAMPTDTQPVRHVAPCQPAPASAPWAITLCNPLGHSRGVGTGGGKL